MVYVCVCACFFWVTVLTRNNNKDHMWHNRTMKKKCSAYTRFTEKFSLFLTSPSIFISLYHHPHKTKMLASMADWPYLAIFRSLHSSQSTITTSAITNAAHIFLDHLRQINKITDRSLFYTYTFPYWQRLNIEVEATILKNSKKINDFFFRKSTHTHTYIFKVRTDVTAAIDVVVVIFLDVVGIMQQTCFCMFKFKSTT